MGLQNAIFTGISGMKANTIGIEVTGNNIANVNTIGFKTGRANFVEVLSQELSTASGSAQIGRGVTLSDISRVFTQGSFETTGTVTDLAIEGNGFFMLKSGQDTLYSRAGQFTIDPDGNMVDPSGSILQGYRSDENGEIAGGLTDIVIDTSPIEPKVTTSAFISANLNASEDVISDPWDATDPINTSNFSTGLSVYDSLGNEHTVTVYFRKTADNTWDWHGLIDGGEVQGGTSGVNTEVGSGQLSFTEEGALNSDYDGVNAESLSISFTGGATAPQSIELDFGDGVSDPEQGTGVNGTTQFKLESNVNLQNQNGYGAGHLTDMDISIEGHIYGIYSNGQRIPMYQIPLADFLNYEGLKHVGNSQFQETSDSGQAIVSSANIGKVGKVNARTLENSNVDLSDQLVKLIIYQRGFQASTKTINTASDTLRELINIV